nr:unknown [Zea mays]
MTDNVGGCCSTPSTPWGGPYLCSGCRKKKDAMEGKRSNRSTTCR